MSALINWPVGISALAFAVNAPLVLLMPRLGKPKDGVQEASEEAYHAMFGIAHHDIWWAKEHAWTIITYVVGVVVTLVVVDMKDLKPPEVEALSLLYVVTAVLAIWYTGRMQSDMAVARIRSAFLVRHTPGLAALVERLVRKDTDYYRGSWFMLGLALLSAGVSSIAVAVLNKNISAGWYTYASLACFALASIHSQVAYRAYKTRDGLFEKPAPKAP